MPPERKSDRLPADAARRMRAGSERGSARVRQEFEGVITRKRFCEQVGIHASTLKRWERAGVVAPTMQSVLGIQTATYEVEDVETGRIAARLLAENRGTLGLEDAFRRARAEARR